VAAWLPHCCRSPFDISATASSLVNGLGSLGPIIQGIGTGALVAVAGWSGLFYAMSAFCCAAALLLLPVARAELSHRRVAQQAWRQWAVSPGLEPLVPKGKVPLGGKGVPRGGAASDSDQSA
jgi:MFS family permease